VRLFGPRREQPEDRVAEEQPPEPPEQDELPPSVLAPPSVLRRQANRADRVGRRGIVPPAAWRGAHGDGGWMNERW
jgi:hypothetical protein